MFWEILIAIVLGVYAGCFTGLVPGIHINLVSLLVLGSASLLSEYLSLLALACFIISMGITHTFLDVIPSIFLGAPDEAEALGVLPGHRFLLKGQGYNAVKLSVIGAFFGLLFSIIFAIPVYFLIKHFYSSASFLIPYILIASSAYMILRDSTKLWAVLVFGLSGILGLLVFSLETLNDPLFPLLSGLFGVSTLIYSIKEKNSLPVQRPEPLRVTKIKLFKALFSGNVSAFITSTFPGLSTSIAATISVQATKGLHDDGFLMLLGAIGTAGFSLSLVTLLAIEKARNGAVIVVQKLVGSIGLDHVSFFVCACLVSGGLALILSLRIARACSRFISDINYTLVCLIVTGFITALVLVFTGWLGLLVLLASTALGLVPAVVKCTRTQAMGCLILPVLLFFLV